MLPQSEHNYFFSIQPFWDPIHVCQQISCPGGHISVAIFRWQSDVNCCVPGNGQVGIMLYGPEDFHGYCYGVLNTYGSIPLHNLKHGYLIRFSPGNFSKVCGIPAKLIDPSGVALEDIFTSHQIAQMKDASASLSTSTALLDLFGAWAERSDITGPVQEQKLARQVTKLIWDKQGQIRVRELEQETAYSTRHLQDVVGRQVGITPKQMCRQVRFQNTLHFLHTDHNVSLSWAAQMLGYSDQAHLCREFKQFCGLSPVEYQKQFLK